MVVVTGLLVVVIFPVVGGSGSGVVIIGRDVVVDVEGVSGTGGVVSGTGGVVSGTGGVVSGTGGVVSGSGVEVSGEDGVISGPGVVETSSIFIQYLQNKS